MTNNVCFFPALDSKYGSGLWVTDGTVAGTYEVGGLLDAGVAGVTPLGLQPYNLTAFGNGILFLGEPSSLSGPGLWFSDGTAAGTFEIGGFNDAGVSGAGSHGLDPALGFTVFGSEALFNGMDSTGEWALWVTNGTAAGTIELGGLRNAGLGVYFDGISAAQFKVFGNEVLFSGTDSDDYQGLWVTNGTTSGTFELGGLRDAGLSGAPAAGAPILNSASLGNEELFYWSDAAGFGLWVTNGTTAGTYEIGGLENKGVAGAESLVNGVNIASIGNEAVMSGVDTSSYSGLWVANGTVSGTQQIGGVGNAALNGGTPFELSPDHTTAFGNKAVFLGFDPNSWSSLWVTDGTTSGTFEIGGIGNAGVPDASPHGLVPGSFTAMGNKVLFDGTDASGQTTLWVTDGPLAGTSEIGGLDNAGVSGAAKGGLLTADIVADGNNGFFYAYDAAGNDGLWVTDGTAAGTHELSNSIKNASNPVVAMIVPAAFAVDDLTTGVQSLSDGTPYTGPVSGLLDQYIYTGSDNLNVAAGVANTFIHTGSGEDAIDVSHVGGTNVLDGGTNSNFLVGGTGAGSFDTFFVDDRGPSADIWSTVANFHSGDAATIFGITPNGFNTAWVNGQGAAGYTGLTLHVTAPGVPTASLTLSGYTTADLTNGTLTTSYGTENDGTPYLYVHAN